MFKEILLCNLNNDFYGFQALKYEFTFNLVALVDKALAYERDQRFTDATAFRAELAQVRQSLADDDVMLEAKVPDVKPVVPDTVASHETPRQQATSVERLLQNLDSFDPSDSSDADVEAMVEIFTNFERSLVAIKQYGGNHPEPKRRFAETFRRLAGALMSCDVCLSWNLTPYGFIVRDRLVWEPASPWNRVPYQLFSDGIRTHVAVVVGGVMVKLPADIAVENVRALILQ